MTISCVTGRGHEGGEHLVRGDSCSWRVGGQLAIYKVEHVLPATTGFADDAPLSDTIWITGSFTTSELGRSDSALNG
ncbi:hypothetical protein [Arboricoccus pini]|uniref:hypothetical protein n=1 Tax=Arboricoccus pini TaxID=1963835 RepID=UPI000B50C04F|nr:hypothetical protein [Arboricoccus pini]